MEICLHGITKRFEKKQVIRPTSLTIDSGSFTTLLGPSGCGKTTLLRMIAGLETPDDGEIYFDGTCVFSREKRINLPPERRGLGFVFQDFALWPHMTVFENVAFGLRARKDTKDLPDMYMLSACQGQAHLCRCTANPATRYRFLPAQTVYPWKAATVRSPRGRRPAGIHSAFRRCLPASVRPLFAPVSVFQQVSYCFSPV